VNKIIRKSYSVNTILPSGQATGRLGSEIKPARELRRSIFATSYHRTLNCAMLNSLRIQHGTPPFPPPHNNCSTLISLQVPMAAPKNIRTRNKQSLLALMPFSISQLIYAAGREQVTDMPLVSFSSLSAIPACGQQGLEFPLNT